MNEKELYRQKKQAQLDAWHADVDKLKAKAAEASADTKIEINKQVKSLEAKIQEGRTKLSELSEASEGTWEAIKDTLESSLDSMKSAFSEATEKLKK